MADLPVTTDAPPVDAARQVFDWIIRGNSELEIMESIALHFPTEEAKPLIVKAFEAIQQASAVEPDILKGFCIEATREIYKQAIEVKDYQTALRAIRQLADIAGS